MKKTIYKVYGFINSLKNPLLLKESFLSIFDEEVKENKWHLKIAGEWLLYMQNKDGGYSRKYSLIKGKDKSYIETTGYIIPTLIDLGLYLNEKKFINSGLKAGEFLLNIQNDDGSFSEIDTNKPFAFDTGQCLIGLNFLYEFTRDKRFFKAAKKAAYWLFENQEDDGSWQKVAYNNEKHTYYSRVAAAMFKFSMFENDDIIKKAALKHIKWVLSNQLENGFFKYSSFLEKKPPFLHTLMYVLEGLLDVYEYTKDERILQAILKNSEVFKDLNLTRDIFLCSQYNEKFECVNNQRCITGLAQWAGVALRIYNIIKDENYKKVAAITLFYLKAKQLKRTFLKGGFSASIPFWGEYGAFDFVNWNNKFFIDSLLLYDKLPSINEQEEFVKLAFSFNKNVVTNNLSYMDKKYIQEIKKTLKAKKVLDIGAGEGVIIKELKKEFNEIDFIGVDPVFNNDLIKKGSIYKLPFEEETFDAVFLFEVLQHTYIESALDEVYRVLKKGGSLYIGERNPISILGFLKRFLELKNKWMYPFDSPFKEKWYKKNEWINILKRAGFMVEEIKVLEGSGKKFVNRYFFIRARK